MTSGNLFFKLLMQDFRKRIWCPICIFILDFLMLEVVFLLKAEDILRYQKTYQYPVSYYLSDIFFANNCISPMMIMTIVSAIVCGISGYVYLHNCAQLDFYHSLPVKRGLLYCAHYVAGVLYYIIPLLIHVIICLAIGIGNNAFSMHALGNALCYIGTSLLVFLVVYSTCILAVMLTGNLILTILGAGILLTYSRLLEILRDILFQDFFYTNISGRNQDFAAFSPLHMILRLFEHADPVQMTEPFNYSVYFSYLVLIGIAVLILSICGYLLYLVRPTEAAGKAVVFKASEPIIKAGICIPLSLYSGAFFENLSPSMRSFGWFLFGVGLGFILSALFMEILFRMDIRCAFHHCRQLLFDGACIALIVAVFKTDALGYNTYVPSDAEIENCSVSISGLMSVSSQRPFGYENAEDYRLEHMHISDNPSLIQLARKAAASGLRYTDIEYYEGIEETEEYQNILEKEASYTNISFAYHLKSGKSIYRQYYINLKDEESYALLEAVYNDIDYKANSMPLFATGWNTSYDYVNCIGEYTTGNISLNEEKQTALLEAYQTEFMDLNLDEITNTYPVASLEFVSNEVTVNQNTYYPSDSGYLVYPSFVRTIELLKEYGFDCREKLSPESIDALTVTDYSDILEDGSYPHVTYTDPEQIAAITGSMIQDILSYNAFGMQNNNYIIYLGENDMYPYYNSYMTFKPRNGQLPQFATHDLEEIVKQQNN